MKNNGTLHIPYIAALRTEKEKQYILEAPTLEKIEWIMGLDNLPYAQAKLQQQLIKQEKETIDTKRTLHYMVIGGFLLGLFNNVSVNDLFNGAGLFIFAVSLLFTAVVYFSDKSKTKRFTKQLANDSIYDIIMKDIAPPKQQHRYNTFKDCINKGLPLKYNDDDVTFNDALFKEKIVKIS